MARYFIKTQIVLHWQYLHSLSLDFPNHFWCRQCQNLVLFLMLELMNGHGGDPEIVFLYISHSSMQCHCSCPSVDFISFLKAICSFYTALSKYMISKVFFFFFASSSLFSWTQIVVLLLHSNSNFLFDFWYETNCYAEMRYMSWSAGKALWSVCPVSLLLQAPWKHCLVPQGLEKLLKSHCSTEQSVTLWIIVCSYTF